MTTSEPPGAVDEAQPEEPEIQARAATVEDQRSDGRGKPWLSVLRYQPKDPVSWFTPREILLGAYEAYVASLFSSFADSRERQAALRKATAHHNLPPSAPAAEFVNDQLPWHKAETERLVDEDDPESGDQEEVLWVDYLADLGDGFDATYTVAQQIARPVAVDGENLPAAQMIVMGGDEVYPSASEDNYRNRTIGPYRSTLGPESATRVPLFAVPGNHDWYDGLSSFLDNFTVFAPKTDRARYRGWSKHQTRSYFAVQLSDQWWMWGIDIALDAYVDAPQLDYFRKVAAMMPDGSRIVLCTAKPSWLRRSTKGWISRLPPLLSDNFGPSSTESDWDRLDYFISRTVAAENRVRATSVNGAGAGDDPARNLRIRLVLSGDKHFYARHQSDDREVPVFVVSGGGGAYLSSTRESPEKVVLSSNMVRSQSLTLNEVQAWPSRTESAGVAWAGLWRIPLRNPTLGLLMGVIYALLNLAAVEGSSLGRSAAIEYLASRSFSPSGWWDAIAATANSFAGFVLWGVVFIALVAFAGVRGGPRLVVIAASVFHVFLHLVGVGVSALVAARIAGFTGGSPIWVYLMSSVGLGAVIGLLAVTFYLLIVPMWGINLNELFAGIGWEGYKQFVRLRITDERIDGFVVGFRRVSHWSVRWDDDRPIVSSDDDPEPRIVDRFTVWP